MNTEHFEKFSKAYSEGLAAANKAEPENYFYKSADEVAVVAARMLTAIGSKPYGVNYSGGGFKRACKALGIKNTRKAIFEYLEIT